MKQKRLSSKLTIAIACVLATAGIVFSAFALIDSLKQGIDWYRFIPAALYVLCFVDLVLYATTGAVGTKASFDAILLNYGLVVIFTGLLFPPVFPHGSKVFFLAISALVVVGLIGFRFSWKDVRRSRLFLIYAITAELASAIAAIKGNPMALSGDTVAVISLFIRPVIICILILCYQARMAEKVAREGAEKK